MNILEPIVYTVVGIIVLFLAYFLLLGMLRCWQDFRKSTRGAFANHPKEKKVLSNILGVFVLLFVLGVLIKGVQYSDQIIGVVIPVCVCLVFLLLPISFVKEYRRRLNRIHELEKLLRESNITFQPYE